MRYRTRLATATVMSALMLNGCAVAGPDFVSPATSAPAQYQSAPSAGAFVFGDPSAGQAWWTAFGATDLDQLVTDALKGSPTVQDAEAALASASAAMAVVEGARAPQASLTASPEEARINSTAFGFTGFPPRTISRYAIGARMSYDLDLFGANRRAAESAKARLDGQAYQLDAARLTVAGNTARTAILIAALRTQIASSEAVIADDRQTLALAQKSVDAGASGRIELLRVQTQLEQDQAILPSLKRDLAVAQNALAALTGHAPGDWTARSFALDQFKVPSSLPMAVPAALVHGRPDIMAAEMTYHAAIAQIGVERARLYPNLNITAQFAQTALTPDGLINGSATGWSLATGLTAPLLNGGALKAKTRQAEAEAKRAQARYQATVLKAFVEVADGLEGVSASEAELRLRKSALTTAEDNLRLVRRAYELGSLRLVDVLDAQRQANGARQAFARTQGQRLLAYADLYAATATVSRPD
ncbi:MAG: hypothetical protein RJA87_428 [Pseudomonadota bacterium]